MRNTQTKNERLFDLFYENPFLIENEAEKRILIENKGQNIILRLVALHFLY